MNARTIALVLIERQVTDNDTLSITAGLPNEISAVLSLI
jgi:hypothetical protein